jgi:hypothetical protein
MAYKVGRGLLIAIAIFVAAYALFAPQTVATTDTLP